MLAGAVHDDSVNLGTDSVVLKCSDRHEVGKNDNLRSKARFAASLGFKAIQCGMRSWEEPVFISEW